MNKIEKKTAGKNIPMWWKFEVRKRRDLFTKIKIKTCPLLLKKMHPTMNTLNPTCHHLYRPLPKDVRPLIIMVDVCLELKSPPLYV